MSIIRETIDCGTWRERKPSSHKLWLHNRPSIDCESIEGGWGRARGLLGGAFMGTLLAQQGDKPTARDYVQNGLVTMFDGIENAGWGSHSASITTWTNLVDSNADYDLSGLNSYTVNGDHILATSKGTNSEESYIDLPGVADANAFTVECCLSPISRATTDNFTYFIGNHYCSVSDDCYAGKELYVFGYVSEDRRQYKYARNYDTFLTLASTTDGYAAFNGEPADIDVTWSSTITLSKTRFYIMWGTYRYRLTCRLYSIRLYNRALTAAEIAANYAVDKARFNLK